MLYWTDWSRTSSAIYRSSVVNPERETLVSGGLVWPNALTIDFTGNESYDTCILVGLSIKVKLSVLVTRQWLLLITEHPACFINSVYSVSLSLCLYMHVCMHSVEKTLGPNSQILS